MMDTLEKVSNLTVIKRNGKKVDFDGAKIALAIKKGFDHVTVTNGDDEEKNIQKKIFKLYIKKLSLEWNMILKIKKKLKLNKFKI